MTDVLMKEVEITDPDVIYNTTSLPIEKRNEAELEIKGPTGELDAEAKNDIEKVSDPDYEIEVEVPDIQATLPVRNSQRIDQFIMEVSDHEDLLEEPLCDKDADHTMEVEFEVNNDIDDFHAEKPGKNKAEAFCKRIPWCRVVTISIVVLFLLECLSMIIFSLYKRNFLLF